MEGEEGGGQFQARRSTSNFGPLDGVTMTLGSSPTPCWMTAPDSLCA